MKIGQEVVCIKGHVNSVTNEVLVEGNIYTIIGVTSCKCKELVDVGFRSTPATLCRECNTQFMDNIWWLNSNRFMPIDEIDISEIEEIILMEEVS